MQTWIPHYDFILYKSASSVNNLENNYESLKSWKAYYQILQSANKNSKNMSLLSPKSTNRS